MTVPSLFVCVRVPSRAISMTVPFKFSCTLLPSSPSFMTPTLRPARSTASAVLMTRFGFAGGSSALHDAALQRISASSLRVESSLKDSSSKRPCRRCARPLS